MTEVRTHFYEAMVLFPQSAGSDLQGCADHIRDILQRGGAELLALAKWDERRLAYDVKGNKRGIYFLAYFRCATSAMAGIERDLRLSERVLRSLVVRAEHLTEEAMRASDGQTRLADEIKLRSTESAASEPQPAEVASEAPAE